MNKKTLIFIIAVLVGVGVWWFASNPTTTEVTNFQECVEAGNEVMESYPRQCSAGGETFTEDIGNEMEKEDLIKVDNPRPNETVSSTFTISGEARGSWYFEADFPVEVEDSEGNVIANSIATAQGDWMTEDFVPFETQVEISTSTTETGNIFLRKDNPSGLPENDDFLRVPVSFE